MILFMDRAPQRYRSIKVRKHFQQNRKNIVVKWLPKGSPEFNAVEECWRQGRLSQFLQVAPLQQFGQYCFSTRLSSVF